MCSRKGTTSPSGYPGSSLTRSEPSHCLCCLDHTNRRTLPGAAAEGDPEIEVDVGEGAGPVAVPDATGGLVAGNAVGDVWLPELLSLPVESRKRITPMPVSMAPMAARSRPPRERRGPLPRGGSPVGTGYQCQSSSLESRRPMTKSGNMDALRPRRDAWRP